MKRKCGDHQRVVLLVFNFVFIANDSNEMTTVDEGNYSLIWSFYGKNVHFWDFFYVTKTRRRQKCVSLNWRFAIKNPRKGYIYIVHKTYFTDFKKLLFLYKQSQSIYAHNACTPASKTVLIVISIWTVDQVPTWFRSSHSQMFFRIGVLKNFAVFTGKQLCWSLFLTELKRDSNTVVFLRILRNF